MPFLGKFRPKNQILLFKLKFGDQTILNMQISMMLILSALDRKYYFWANLVQKIKVTIVGLSLVYIDYFEYAEFK